MKKHIEKLIAEYDVKIADCDTQINGLKKDKKLFRKKHWQLKLDDCRAEMYIKQVQRQAYIQAKSDIDSLLDYT